MIEHIKARPGSLCSRVPLIVCSVNCASHGREEELCVAESFQPPSQACTPSPGSEGPLVHAHLDHHTHISLASLLSSPLSLSPSLATDLELGPAMSSSTYIAWHTLPCSSQCTLYPGRHGRPRCGHLSREKAAKFKTISCFRRAPERGGTGEPTRALIDGSPPQGYSHEPQAFSGDALFPGKI